MSSKTQPSECNCDCGCQNELDSCPPFKICSACSHNNHVLKSKQLDKYWKNPQRLKEVKELMRLEE